MAAIDKIYLKTYKSYVDLLKWTEEANKDYRKLLENHGVDDLSNFVWRGINENAFDKNLVPVCNNNRFLDMFFAKFCPIQEVQDELRVMYGESYRDLPLQENYGFRPLCKKVKVIYPYKRKIQRPIGYGHCFELEFYKSDINDFYMFYNDRKWHPINEWCGEMLHTNLSFNSVKAVVKFLLKTAPYGLTFKLSDYYSTKDSILLKTYE